ncbi:hypothetical protein DM867_11135 [Halosegnis rubeus]|uniref:Uncharacterized protein n=1 Tax=Halosegnis rubeus TaxID=2212850 RepID=A0A5N5U3B6_9EURY|nr:hypothetical protein DM867_11135 [Halosegnis rubeus]
MCRAVEPYHRRPEDGVQAGQPDGERHVDGNRGAEIHGDDVGVHGDDEHDRHRDHRLVQRVRHVGVGVEPRHDTHEAVRSGDEREAEPNEDGFAHRPVHLVREVPVGGESSRQLGIHGCQSERGQQGRADADTVDATEGHVIPSVRHR